MDADARPTGTGWGTLSPPIITKEEIEQRVMQMAAHITFDYMRRHNLLNEDKPPVTEPIVVMPVLAGAMFFATDLLRRLAIPTTVYPVVAHCYLGTQPDDTVRVDMGTRLHISVRGKHVLVVDDILDTGMTLDAILHRLETQHVGHVDVCMLLTKKKQRPAYPMDWGPKYNGFHIDDEFVVGYGMDYNGQYRNLRSIYTLTEG